MAMTTQGVIQQMEEAMDRVVAFLNREDLVWRTEPADERCRVDFPDAVHYVTDNEVGTVLLVSATLQPSGQAIASGVATFKGDEPLLINLPLPVALDAIELARKAILKRN